MRTPYRRRKDLHNRNYDGGATGKFGHDHWVRDKGCLIDHECVGKVEAAHVHARGMGGHNGSWMDLVNLCSGAHELAGPFPKPGAYQGSIRQLFEAHYGVDLEATAARYVDEHLAEHGLTRDDLVDGLVAA